MVYVRKPIHVLFTEGSILSFWLVEYELFYSVFEMISCYAGIEMGSFNFQTVSIIVVDSLLVRYTRRL